MRSLTVLCLGLLAATSAACGGAAPATQGPLHAEIPVTDGIPKAKPKKAEPKRESPPASGKAKESPFPAVARAKLANGMGLAVVTSKALPVVQIRVLVRAGAGFGAQPAVGELTATMLKDGGTQQLPSSELLRRIETLGANLSVDADTDGTIVGTAVTKDQLGEALSLVAQVVREPRFDEGELKKLKARETDEADDALRSSGAFTASRVLFKELFPQGGPYGTRGLLPSEIAKVDGAAVRDFHRKFFVPKATTLVLAGDIDEPAAKALAEKHFGSWTGGEPPKVDFPAPKAPEKTRVLIAHRPKSAQSDVFVAALAPERKSKDWAELRIANHVLGGGVASRLFLDVREQRSLAYRVSAQINELAHGDQPLVTYAGTQTPKTAEAVTGLVENFTKMASSPPTGAESDSARRYLSDIFAIRLETIGSIANMVVAQDELGLPDGYWDAYRAEVRKADQSAIDAAAKKLFGADKLLIVVSGDADAVDKDLTRFGEVTVVDPEKEFKVVRTLPQAAAQ